jgi:hypothetical protein
MAHTNSGLEHRWGERVCVDIPVGVSAAASARVGGCVKNLSLTGAFLKCDCELRLHALIEVHIELPQPAGRVVVVEAYVSRKVDEGVGIEWCRFAPNIVKELLRDGWVRFTEQAGEGGNGAMTASSVS